MNITKFRIREAMERKGMRQADLSKTTGIDKGQISSYLSGKYVPKQDNIYLLAKALGVSEAYLMGYDSKTHADTFSEMFEKLDEIDRAKVEAYIDGLLSADKYQKKIHLQGRPDSFGSIVCAFLHQHFRKCNLYAILVLIFHHGIKKSRADVRRLM